MKDGCTLRQHLEAARAQGADPAELHGPECPPEAAYVWRLFCALNAKRTGGMGPGPIASTEIEAWSRLRGLRLTVVELDWIDALDAAFLATPTEAEPA